MADLKKEIDKMVGVKKVYTKRFVIHDVNKLEKIAEEIGSDVNKLMDLSFKKLIKEYEDGKAAIK